jgi:hypothetical protein
VGQPVFCVCIEEKYNDIALDSIDGSLPLSRGTYIKVPTSNF